MDSKVKVDLIQHLAMNFNAVCANNVVYMLFNYENKLPIKFNKQFVNYFNSVLSNSGLEIDGDSVKFSVKLQNDKERLNFLSMCSAVFLRQVYHLCMFLEYHRDDLSDIKPYEKACLQTLLNSYKLQFVNDNNKLILKQQENG